MKFALGKKLRKILWKNFGLHFDYTPIRIWSKLRNTKTKFALGKKLWKISIYILTIQYEFGANLEILRWNCTREEVTKDSWKNFYILTIQYEFGTNLEILKWNWNKVEDAKTKFANSKELQRSLFLRFVEKFRVLSINVIHVHVIIGNGIQVNAQPLSREEGLNDLVASFPRGR